MKWLKFFFDFYLNSSIHVALSTFSLVLLTYHFAHIPVNFNVSFFVFLSTILSYNFIKFYNLFFFKKNNKSLQTIFLLSIISLIGVVFLFFKLNFKTQFSILIFGLLTLFYAVPISNHSKNLRNLAGIKIYIVSFCWAGVTLLLPLINADLILEDDIFFKFIQRFVLTLILILIFEINDLKYDDVKLKTVPQTIGILNTKKLIYSLLFLFYILEFFKIGVYPNQWWINIIIVGIVFIFTYFANSNRSKYYTLFWVEAVPILWMALSLIFKT